MTAIGQLRLERGLTQKQLAAAVGKSKSTVRDWEHGNYRPSDQDFPKIAEALECSVAIIWIPPKEGSRQRRVRSVEEEAAEAANREKAAPYIERRVALGLTKKETRGNGEGRCINDSRYGSGSVFPMLGNAAEN